MSYIGVEEFKGALLARPLIEIVREYVFRGEPYVFQDWPEGFNTLRHHLSNTLNISEENVIVIGSAKIGFSLNPDNYPRKFSETSDIDILIVDEGLFDTIWITILKWHYPRRYNRLYGEDRGWAGERKKDTYWGWFVPDQIRFNGLSFPSVLKPLRDLSTGWFNAFRSLSKYKEFAGRDVRGRLYRTWDHALLYHLEGLRQIQSIILETEIGD